MSIQTSSFFESDVQRVEKCVHYNSFTEPISEIIEIKWEISNFNKLNHDVGFNIQSPLYPSKHIPKLMWYMSFYPNGRHEDDEEEKGCCSLYLYKQGAEAITVDFTLKMLNKRNHPYLVGKSPDKVFDAGHGKNWGYAGVVKRSDLDSKIGKDNILIIMCTIYYKIDGTDLISTTYMHNQNKNLKRTSDGQIKSNIFSNGLALEQFFYNDSLSDIKLVSPDETFNAHKVILCSASPVFMDIFGNAKKRNSSVNITDISSNVIKEMLRYIYTGKIVNLSHIAYELVAAADKYHIVGLKEECEKTLCDCLTVENLLDMLKIAESHGLTQLYTNISNLFLLHKSKIVFTPEFKKLENSNPSIISKLFISLVEKEKI